MSGRLTVASLVVIVAVSGLVGSVSADLAGAIPARPSATIIVGPSANGRTIRVHVGDRLVVRLPGNPTTGYRWSVARIPTSLRLLGSVYVPSPPERIGQGGTFVFRFKATSGSGSLRLIYRRPWEKRTPPLRTFVLTVRTR